MSQSQAYRQAIQAMSGLNQFSQFGNHQNSGDLEFAARCYHRIATLIGWQGAHRVNRDIGALTPVGYMSHALHSLLDDVSGQINN